MWTGSEWIPAPPTSVPDVAPLPDGSVVSVRIPPKGKLIALSIVGLLIVSATIGILYLTGIIGETIEGKWYGDDGYIEFRSDGYYYYNYSNYYNEVDGGAAVGQWRVEGDYIVIDQFSSSSSWNYEIDKGWLFFAPQGSTSGCFAYSRESMPVDSYENAIHDLRFPAWCGGWIYEGTDTTAQTLNVYDADDANDAASPETDDVLIRLQLTGQDTLSWTFVSIQLSVGDIVTSCGVVEGPDGDGCYIDQQGDYPEGTAWEPGEFIFLHENGVDIVTNQGTTVGISVTYNGHTVAGSGSQLVN